MSINTRTRAFVNVTIVMALVLIPIAILSPQSSAALATFNVIAPIVCVMAGVILGAKLQQTSKMDINSIK